MMLEAIEKLTEGTALTRDEYIQLLSGSPEPEEAEFLRRSARLATDRVFGRAVRIRGLIEITNVCRNNCYYCGIRRGNRELKRYTLSKADILGCCRTGHRLGFRTFVLQGGENPAFGADAVEDLVGDIHRDFPDSAITLSLGEWSDEDLRRFREAGAERYLLRHETFSPLHYSQLHPPEMSRGNRLRCLRTLKRLGYQTGTGIMVGSPFQTPADIADDLLFMRELKPEMIGIGPFLPHSATPFADRRAGSIALTLRLISILRLMFPCANIPATTALATLHPSGRSAGLLAGANVIMPNLSPPRLRNDYALYDNKAAFGAESAEGLGRLRTELAHINLFITTEKGDYADI